MKPHFLVTCCLTLAMLWPWGPVATAGQDPTLADVTVGLGGVFKVGHWTPVLVTIDGGGSDFVGNLELTAPDSDDVVTRFIQGADTSIAIPRGERWTGWRYVKLGKVRGRLQVVLRAADGTLVSSRSVERVTPATATAQWVVSVGPDVGVAETAVFLARVRGEKLTTSVLQEREQFPDRWFGYEGVDVLLVTTGTESVLERLSDEQYGALFEWLQLGGRLVFSAGKRAEELFRDGSRFHALRPGELFELDTYWKASGLENYARAAERLTSNDEAPLAVFQSVRGRTVCYEGAGGAHDRALVIQYPCGLGLVTYLALDLEQPPLAQWPARSRLLARLLQSRSEDEDASGGQDTLGQVTHVGYDDISGQLRSALDQYSHVTMVRFSWVAGLLVVYLLVLGPLDFFGLHKLGRPQWTWFTFPLIVVACCALAVWLSQRWKGDRLKANQIDVVDVDFAEGTVRGTTWASIYSPRAARLALDLVPQPGVTTTGAPGVLLSWNGLPGTGLGGMNTTAAVDVLSDEYTIRYERDGAASEPAALAGLPINASASKGLFSRWWTSTESLTPSRLKATAGGTLEGVVVNPLDVELSHGFVYYENWAYPIEGRLGPGDTVDLQYITALDLKWQLSRRRVIESREAITPWDRADLSDPARVAEMLMFYGAASGRVYTRLSHSYQSYVDLSQLLHTGQAILVGVSRTPASVLHCDGQPLADSLDRQWTYYRVSLPVQPPAADTR
ncbi:MAG: hypothetical protein GXY58_19230 [Planctomycetaceae bacterium]|nr:hypothetical protein [Planctomycetaceae bacterium]